MYNVQEYHVPRNSRFPFMPPENSELIILENEAYRMRFSPRTGLLHSITTKAKIQTTKNKPAAANVQVRNSQYTFEVILTKEPGYTGEASLLISKFFVLTENGKH